MIVEAYRQPELFAFTADYAHWVDKQFASRAIQRRLVWVRCCSGMLTTNLPKNSPAHKRTNKPLAGVTVQSGGTMAAAGAATLNEIQTVTVTGVGGTFTLTFNGQTTSALSYNAPAITVQSALQGLSSIGSGNRFGMPTSSESQLTNSGEFSSSTASPSVGGNMERFESPSLFSL